VKQAKDPTPEQEAVVRSEGRIIAVSAFAGTGKTTTLVHFARARPQERILYLAFNKAIQMEASAKFPENVTCRTTHAIAYRKAAMLFGAQVKEKIGNTWPSVIARRLDLPSITAAAAVETLQSWFGSSNDAIELEHVPEAYRERVGAAGKIVDVARAVYQRMLDPDDAQIKAPHDSYLKLFAMDKPVLKGFDRILVDEAQDLNQCSLDIALGQSNASLVFVGDRHQAIYGFRKAVNAMELVNADSRPALTTSFRFGRGIGEVANQLLSQFKGETLRITGVGPQTISPLKIDEAKPFAVVARTNAAIFAEAVTRLGERKPYAFVGGLDSYRLDRVVDAYHLSKYDHAQIKDPYLRSFSSIAELDLLAEALDERELKRLVKVTVEYGKAIPELVAKIREKAVAVGKDEWASFKGTVFTTAHKSKGLEWDQVHMTDDFTEFFDRDGKPLGAAEIEEEEVNIVYVALTRAKKAVRPCATLERWLATRLPVGRR
jgi:superfamily I DNA/RNA helicase